MMDSAASMPPQAENSPSNGDDNVHELSGTTVQVELAVKIKEQSHLDKIEQTLKAKVSLSPNQSQPNNWSRQERRSYVFFVESIKLCS